MIQYIIFLFININLCVKYHNIEEGLMVLVIFLNVRKWESEGEHVTPRAYIGIAHSTLPRYIGNLHLHFFGGNYPIFLLDIIY